MDSTTSLLTTSILRELTFRAMTTLLACWERVFAHFLRLPLEWRCVIKLWLCDMNLKGLCQRWVSWRKRHAALSCPRLAHDNVCEFPNPKICLIMVVSNMDWSGRYWMLMQLYFWGWPVLSGKSCLIPGWSIYRFTFYSLVSLTWGMSNACQFSIYFSSFCHANRQPAIHWIGEGSSPFYCIILPANTSQVLTQNLPSSSLVSPSFYLSHKFNSQTLQDCLPWRPSSDALSRARPNTNWQAPVIAISA